MTTTSRRSAAQWLVLDLLLLAVLAYDLRVWCGRALLQWVEAASAVVALMAASYHALVLARSAPKPHYRPSPFPLSPFPLSPFPLSPFPLSPSPPSPSFSSPRSISPSSSFELSFRARPSDPPSPHSPPSPPSPHSPHSADLRVKDLFIDDPADLTTYLQEMSRVGSDVCPPCSSSAVSGASPQYRVALAAEDTATDEPPQPTQLWWRLRLDPHRLTHYNYNLRLWLQATLVSPLAREAEAAEAALARRGWAGAVSDAALREAARELPELRALLRFVGGADAAAALARLQALAQGACLSRFRWESDAALLGAAWAAYMDALSACAAPCSPGGCAHFSEAHAQLTPGSVDPGRAGPLLALQTRHPPHFVVRVGAHALEVGRGRNNLLRALLVFISLASRPELKRASPALRRLHFGPQGLNLLWVIGQ